MLKTTHLEGTIEIGRPPAEVFDFIADPGNDPAWCPRVKDCRQVEGTEPGHGARYAVLHHPSLNRPHTRWIEITRFDRPRLIATRQEDEVGVFEITYELEEAGGGTRFRQSDDITWKVPLPGRPIARRIVGRHIGEQQRNLKRVLESGR